VGGALLILPVTSILLASVYVDIETALFVLAAAHFATRAPLRLRDVWIAALCLAMAIGAKILALAPVGFLSLIVLGRVLWAHTRARPRATVLTIVGGITLMSAMVAATYLRNWLHFKNPFWPDLPYDNARFNIHWPGMKGAIEDPLPFATLLDHLTSIPYSRRLGHATQVYEYGFVSAWFVFPLAAACSVALWLTAGRAVIGRVLGRNDWRLDDASLAAFYLSITLLGSLYIAPVPFWGARYFIAHVGLAMALISWAGCRRGFERLREGAAAVATVGAIVSFFWVTPRWWYWPSELRTLAAIP